VPSDSTKEGRKMRISCANRRPWKIIYNERNAALVEMQIAS